MGIEDLAAGLDDLSGNREALTLLILQGGRTGPAYSDLTGSRGRQAEVQPITGEFHIDGERLDRHGRGGTTQNLSRLSPCSVLIVK